MIGVFTLCFTSIFIISLIKTEVLHREALKINGEVCKTPQNDTINLARNQKEDEHKMRSCENRCGIPKNTSSMTDFYCQCDDECPHFEDCCADYERHCALRQNMTEPRGKRSRYTCVRISSTNMVYMSSTCLSKYSGSTLESKCKGGRQLPKLEEVPVYDPEANETYKNIHCARCNDVKNFKFWEIKLICNSYLIDENDLLNPGSTMVLKLLTSAYCDHHFMRPKEAAKPRSCLPTLNTCPTGTNETLLNLCESNGFYALSPPGIYNTYVLKNFYCWMCATKVKTFEEINKPRCRLHLYQIRAEDKDFLDLSVFSFRILLDVTREDDVLANAKPGKGLHGLDLGIICNSNGGCSTLSCPKGYVHKGKKCVFNSVIVSTVLYCLVWVNDTEKIEINIKYVFEPLGYIDSLTGYKSGIQFFKFNTIFPVDFIESMIHEVMEMYIVKITNMLNVPINVTYDVTFMKQTLPSTLVTPFLETMSDPKQTTKPPASCGNHKKFFAGQLIIILTFSAYIA